ncbi:MAG: LEPR-XLL domain-containing protein [Phycisphaerae bacterium]|jgi:hypothetical protein
MDRVGIVFQPAHKRLLNVTADAPWTGVESLEPRVLLSGFTDAALSGTLALQGMHDAGAVVMDGAGLVTSASLTHEDGTSISMTGTYNVTSSGVVTVDVHNVGSSSTYDGVGALNTTKDVVAANYASLPNSDTEDAGLNLLVKHSLGTFSNADVSGTWSFSGESVHGTVTFDGKGNITGGSFVTSNDSGTKSVTGSVTGGTYSVTSDGTVTFSPHVSGSSGQPDTLVGTLNDSKDVMAFDDQNLGSQPGYEDGDDADLLVMVKYSGTYSNADANGTWTLAGMHVKGTVTFNGKGGLTGQATDKDGTSMTLSGTYTVNANGVMSAHIVATGTDGGTVDLVGAMDRSKNVIGFGTSLEDSDHADMVVLVNSAVTATATKLAFTQQPTTTTAGSKINPAVTVNVLDSDGDVVTADKSTVTLTLASGPTGATLGGTVTAKAVNGVATFNNLTLTKAGTYILQATDGALTGTTSDSFNVVAGAATKLAFLQSPTSTKAGSVINPAVTVELLDANGNVATADASSVALAIASGPTGATLGGTATAKVVNGVATFNNLTLAKVGAYTLKATDGSLKAVTSASFTISPGAAAKLAFVQQPTGTAAGSKINPAVKVDVMDACGNVITTDTSNVALAIATGPAGTTLGGTGTVKAVSGVATFNNLTLTKAGTYTLTATDGSLTLATSNSFTVTPGAAAKLAFLQQPTGTTANTVISPAVTVQILDANNNVVTTNTSSVTLAIASGPSGAKLGGTVKIAAAAGVATFNNLTLSKAGPYTLKATDGSLTLVISNSLTIT